MSTSIDTANTPGPAPRSPASHADAAPTESPTERVRRTQETEDRSSQQLVRYEALFKLMDELRNLDDIAAIADLSARRWKYFASIGSWRLVVLGDDVFTVIDSSRSKGIVSECRELSAWDARHWQDQHPCLLHGSGLTDLQPPDHLANPSREVQVMPFLSGGRCIAVLSAAAGDGEFAEVDKKFVRLFGGHLADHIAVVLLRRQALQALLTRATHDGLTGALNRSAIVDRLATQTALAVRTERPLSVLVVDIDFFKKINDTYGHGGGDEVLREIVRRFQILTRTSEAFGRYGGEEFLFVLYPCSTDEAVVAANRFLKGVSDVPFNLDGAHHTGLPVSISIGVACSSDLIAPSADELIKRADGALYDSKKNGRNRVTLARADASSN